MSTLSFRLIVLPDGRAVLTTEAPLSDEAKACLREAWERFRSSSEGVLIFSSTSIEHVSEIELRLNGERLVAMTESQP